MTGGVVADRAMMNRAITDRAITNKDLAILAITVFSGSL